MTRLKKSANIFLAYLLIALVFIPTIGLAAPASTDSYKVLAPLPCIESPARTITDSSGNSYTVPAITCPEGNGALQTKVSFKTYVQYAFNLLIALAAVAAVVMIVWGGFEYMLSGTVMGKNDGIGRVKNALFGLVLVLGSYLLLRTIDPRLVNISTTLVPPLNLSATSTAPVTLLQQLEADANEFDLRRDQIGALLQETAAKKQAKQAELDGINAKLAEMSSSEPEYQSLIVAKAKTENELKKLGVNYQVQLAKSALNGVQTNAMDAAMNISSKDSKSASDVMKAVEKNKELVDKYDKIATSRLQKMGENDTSKIKELVTYNEAMIDVTKINLMIGSAQVVFLPTGFGGVSSIKRIDLVGMDGKVTNKLTAEARAQVEAEIEKIKKVAKSITDPVSKADLENKVAVVEERLKSNKIFTY